MNHISTHASVNPTETVDESKAAHLVADAEDDELRFVRPFAERAADAADAAPAVRDAIRLCHFRPTTA
eukprot:COSAG03_NODE_3147_length_2182_cov_1.552088_3_plen_67_part_01